MVKMTKNLVHSFYYILYQPKGVPTPRDNFSGTGSTKTNSKLNFAEIVTRGGHPLGLIEYMIERVYQGFLSFELHKFGIFWNLHQPKGVPTPHFSSTYRFLGVPNHHFLST